MGISTPAARGIRRSILDLAPLELDCMNALWRLGEATVRDVHAALAITRPRAYTTIMTILDRLAHKGVVERKKAGRAWLYRPNLSAEQARTHAVARLVEGFFQGSTEALASHVMNLSRAQAGAPSDGASGSMLKIPD
jgi:BlaI family penicillinase repressor